LSNTNKLQNAKNPKKKFTGILKTTKPALLTIEKGSTMMSNSRPTFQKLKKFLQESSNMHLITILGPSWRCT
jgi:hypothetical protein